MSIATEITRLNNAKSSIKSAIENKGVTVPSSATIDTYTDYIDDIPQSGGTTSKWGELTNNDYSSGSVTTNWSANYLLKKIVIPKEVLRIRNFRNNTNLESVEFEEGSNATGADEGSLFEGCTKLKSMTFPNTWINGYNGNTFSGCTSLESANIPSGTTVLGSRSFQYCSNLKSITIPNTVTRIWQNSFSFCSSLSSVTFEENSVLTQIDGWVFNYCPSLKSITLPDSITTLGPCNFAYDTALESIHLPTGITSIGDEMLRNCSALETVNIPNVTTIGRYAFQYTALESVIIPDTVTTINSSAFSNNTSLSTVVVGSGVTTNEGWTFNNCTNLADVTIKEGCQIVGSCMFMNCVSLTDLTIPSTVTTINNEAFRNCNHLNSITFLATTPPTLSNSNIFTDTNNCPLYVPANSVDTYKSASVWSNFASRIQAIP